MDTMIYAWIKGKKRPLHFSMDVMFHVNEKFGSVNEALEKMQQETREGFEVLRTMAVLMANDAELCRRDEGLDPGDILEEKDISVRMKPIDLLNLKQAVANAISAGYKQEHGQEEKEIDLGLLELQKKEEAGK